MPTSGGRASSESPAHSIPRPILLSAATCLVAVTALPARPRVIQHAEERKRITGAEIAKWQSSDILARLDAEDVPSAPLLKRTELLSHEQILANNTVISVDYEGFGEVRQALGPLPGPDR